ncbi:hypothetical protein HaLaN_07256 [Haematococcus lacustris]|uniref:Uncharacterized protein n=1 Tax=Haematococcus lacustris TaxID=44745 RepID=A0A699YQ65_HAELA|nr:hypothetical protein HaLaN_07256 [Haematococcus lacustris]
MEWQAVMRLMQPPAGMKS